MQLLLCCADQVRDSTALLAVVKTAPLRRHSLAVTEMDLRSSGDLRLPSLALTRSSSLFDSPSFQPKLWMAYGGLASLLEAGAGLQLNWQ